MGLFGMILLSPLAVLAVPADLIVAPLRRECDFDLLVQGRLAGWAGSAVGGERLVLEGRSLLEPGLEEFSAPRYLLTRSSATADAGGRFALFLAGRVGSSPAFELHWLVDDRSSGLMSLRKHGGRFSLFEPEPEFGAGEQAMGPIEIRPSRAPSARQRAGPGRPQEMR